MLCAMNNNDRIERIRFIFLIFAVERYNNIIELKEISSTNDYALELARTETVPEFTVIRADFQTKGRGQIGNHWVADSGKKSFVFGDFAPYANFSK